MSEPLTLVREGDGYEFQIEESELVWADNSEAPGEQCAVVHILNSGREMILTRLKPIIQ